MAPPWIRWNNTNGPVTVDKNISTSGRRWSSVQGVGAVEPVNSTIYIPPYSISGASLLWNVRFNQFQQTWYVVKQFNYTAPEAFTVIGDYYNTVQTLNYLNVLIFAFYVICYRVGNKKIRYVFPNENLAFNNIIGIGQPYTGQKILPQFSLEYWTILVCTAQPNDILVPAFNLKTSILNFPEGIPSLPYTISPINSPNLFNSLPSNNPAQWDTNIAWNSN